MRSDYRYICLDCYSKMGNEWQQRNPFASARHKRNHHLLRKFGITLNEANALLVEQGERCAICGDRLQPEKPPFPHVDHDHKTGKVRGILCFSCNAGLGAFKDSPVRLRLAIAYLEREAYHQSA